MAISESAPSAAPPAAPRRAGPRKARSGVVLLALLVLAALASVSVGSAASSAAEVWHALFAPTGTVMDETVRGLRVPRTVTALAAGAALGVAGTITQGHTRNPIAEPGLLGVNQGAALAIVLATALLGPLGVSAQSGLAFAGALAASALVFSVAAVRRAASPTTLILVGAAVTALCAGLVSGTVLMSEAALETLRFWQVGSVAGRNGIVEQLWPALVAGGLLAWLNAGQLNALALGEDTANSLGVSTFRARLVGLAALVLLAGTAVTMAGPIAFAGLVVPHAVRWAFGSDYRWLVPASAVAGAVLLLAADTLGRVIARPGELAVGVVVAIIGAPLFVHIARRRKLAAL